MDTYKRTPLQLFNQPQHFLIPLFQRKYVWTEDDQWVPLWKDIRRVAEQRIEQPHLDKLHFLGAVVLQAQEARSSRVPEWNIIDGQQRLTTLQVVMDSAADVLERLDKARLSRRLGRLTHNDADYIEQGASLLKLRHLNDDREDFAAVIDAPVPVDHGSLPRPNSKLARAHRYFTTAIAEWLDSEAIDIDGVDVEEVVEDRADSLVNVLEGGLQLITIELTADEDSQEIFETLNDRGTPLTAADLVRNFVFQRLNAEGSDTVAAYRQVWPFESGFWSEEVSVGRLKISRSSLFLNQWLTSRIGEEVSPQATFGRFKSYVDQSPDRKMIDLLREIRGQADAYESWTAASRRRGGDLNATEMAVYRMHAGEVEVLKPVLIWLHSPGRDRDAHTIDDVIGIFESWMYRRQLLRLPSADLGRIVADVIKSHGTSSADELADRVRAHLARQKVASTYWPGDAEVRRELAEASVYNRFRRPRLRTFLEAIENYYRAQTGQPQVERAGYPIEHVLPRKWETNWGVDDAEQADERQAHVNRLGNLTLLTTSLNSRVSNGPWAEKRLALLEHNTLKITGRLLSWEDSGWDEEKIDQRTDEMIDVLLAVWPVPEGHEGVVVEPSISGPVWIEIRHLVDAGYLTVGQTLHGRDGTSIASINAGKTITLDGRTFSTPSGAGKHARRGRAVNGWWWWSLSDGRRLLDVRAEYVEAGAE